MHNLGTLERIQLSGFKSIHKMDLELGSLNVLIGANGAGKSNVIGFFRLMRMLFSHYLGAYVAQQGGAEALLYFGSKKTPAIEISLVFQEAQYNNTKGSNF